MKVSEVFKGSFLKAANLGAKPRRYTISSVEFEDVGDERKAVMRFEEGDQALVLNKTNASVLADAWGDEMEGWVGQSVVLRPDKTDFNGRRVDCIRVAVPTPLPTTPPSASVTGPRVPKTPALSAAQEEDIPE